MAVDDEHLALADLLESASLEAYLRPVRLPAPAHYDLAYNVTTLAMTASIFGREEGEEVYLNFLIAKFAQFVCRRPSVLEDFKRWDQNERYDPGNMFSRATMPRGFMTNRVFDHTVVVMQVSGWMRRQKRNLHIDMGVDSVPRVLLEKAQEQGLFEKERDALVELRSARLTQKKLGFS